MATCAMAGLDSVNGVVRRDGTREVHDTGVNILVLTTALVASVKKLAGNASLDVEEDPTVLIALNFVLTTV